MSDRICRIQNPESLLPCPSGAPEEHRNNQVFHHNLNEEEATGYIENAMQEFKQMQMETRKFRYQVLVSKKGKMTIHSDCGEIPGCSGVLRTGTKYCLYAPQGGS